MRLEQPSGKSPGIQSFSALRSMGKEKRHGAGATIHARHTYTHTQTLGVSAIFDSTKRKENIRMDASFAAELSLRALARPRRSHFFLYI